MNELKDKDLREALRRREVRRTKPEVPADFMYNVMQSIQEPASSPKPRSRRVWLYSTIAVAAGILLLLTLHYNHHVETVDQPLTAKHTEQQDSVVETEEKVQMPMIMQETPTLAQAKTEQAKKKSIIEERPTVTKGLDSTSSADRLNDYIARLEAEMDNLDDSVSAARVERLIAADVRLQQLVNRIVGKQVEQAVNELKKDSTAQYINF